MKIYIPWIISRRRFITAAFIDLLLNIFIFTTEYLEKFDSYPNPISTISLASYWIVLSYILGRYMICRRISLTEIIKTITKTIILLLSCNIIYFTLNFSNNFFNLIFGNVIRIIDVQGDQNIFFIKTTLTIATISCIFQYIISIITNKIYNHKKIWLFYGSNNAFNNLKDEININKNNFRIKRIRGINFIKKIDLDTVEGVILDYEENLKNNGDLDHIFFFKSKGIKVLNIIKWCENELHRIPPHLIENKYQIIEKFNLLDNSYKIRIKRIGDFIISLLLLIITFPISIIVSLSIFIEDGGPIFYSQIRTGYKGEKIVIYKFRSMVINAEKFGPQWSQKEDKRITKIGRIIRALRFDELPQLLSVIEGTMSLIGPRPERPEMEKKLLKEIPYYKYRHILKPGISGWAQVNYPYGASKEDTEKKLSYDLYYINHISFFLDFFILFKTMKIIFNAKNYNPKTNS